MASKWLLPTACAVLLLTITTTYAQDNPVEEVSFFFFIHFYFYFSFLYKTGK